jgi:putative ABC transport system permease protein
LGETLGESDIPGVSRSPIALTNIAYAQQLAGLPSRLTRVFVRPAPGRGAAVRAELERLAPLAQANVEPADYDATLFSFASSTNRQAEGLFSGICALVAFMFAINAMLITAPARRRLLEDIRPQGATRPVAAQVILFDAVVLGVLGCALGIGVGDLLSIAAGSAPPDYLTFAFPVGASHTVTAQSVALAVAAGLVATLLGVLWPLRDLLSGSVDTEGAGARSRRSRMLAPVGGLVLLAGATATLVWRPESAVVGSVMLIGALLCLLPAAFDGVIGVVTGIERRVGGASTALAAIALRSPRTRTRSLAIAATAAVAVCGITELGGAQSNLEHGVIATTHGLNSHADVWVLPEGAADVLVTKPFKPDVQGLARLPGVASVAIMRGGFLSWGKRRLWVQAPPASIAQPVAAVQLRSGNLARADAELRQGGWAVISEALAAEHHLRIGDAFVLPSPRSTTLRVAALATNLGWTAGGIILSSEQYARAWGSQAASAYLIATKPGASAVTVRDAVSRTLGPDSGLRAQTEHERQHGDEAVFRAGLARLTEIRLLLLVAAVLAVAGALGAVIWQRRELVALVKCDGFSRGVLWRWSLVETTMLVGASSLIGAAFGLYGVRLATAAVMSVTGYPVVEGLGVSDALLSLLVISGVVGVIVAVPGYLVARAPARTAGTRY